MIFAQIRASVKLFSGYYKFIRRADKSSYHTQKGLPNISLIGHY